MSAFEIAQQAMFLKEPTVIKMLDVSTVHMTREDNDLLTSEHQDLNVCYDNLPNGFLVYIPEDKDAIEECKDLSEGFRTVLHWAQLNGATHVKFDADGDVYPQLPKFDW